MPARTQVDPPRREQRSRRGSYAPCCPDRSRVHTRTRCPSGETTPHAPERNLARSKNIRYLSRPSLQCKYGDRKLSAIRTPACSRNRFGSSKFPPNTQHHQEENSQMKLPRPEFGGRRLLLVASGAVSAMHMPFWLNWLEHGYPDLEVKLVLTRSAERFVSRESLGLLVENEALPDRWPETNGGEGALHIALKEWHDCALVFPACLNYLSRMAQGAADSPSLLALQCSSAPIVVAPSVPQGALDNPIVTANLDRLRLRPNLRLAPKIARASGREN